MGRKVITASLPDEDADAILAIARAEDRTPSAVLRRIVQAHLRASKPFAATKVTAAVNGEQARVVIVPPIVTV